MRGILLFVFAVRSFTSLASGLGVYYPTTASVRAAETALKGDLEKSQIEVTAFSKYSEFTTWNKTTPFDFKIVPGSHIEYSNERNCKPILQFTKENHEDFQYLLLGISEKWNKNNLSSGNLGLVGELDRGELKGFVEAVMEAKFKAIKTTNKVEDLFNMLLLGNADFILISPENLAAEKTKFVSKTYEIARSKAVRYPVVCASSSVEPGQVEALHHISASTIRSLGFTSIKEF